MRVCVIHIFLGVLPPWFNSFLTSCNYNKGIDFLLFIEDTKITSNTENVKIQFVSKEKFEELASMALGFPIILENAYKLCEYKPAFGLIFKDFLEGYDYWGHCDSDLIFGNIFSFLSLEEISKYDVISAYSNFISGPFCLYRNACKTNNLFKLINDYQNIYKNSEWHATEENFIGYNRRFSIFKKGIRKIGFYLYNKLNAGDDLCKKYTNYWRYKRKVMTPGIPRDITEVVWQANDNKSIKALFKGVLKCDREFLRAQQPDWEVSWSAGKLTNNLTKKEMFGFHFIDSKKEHGFKNSFFNESASYRLTKYGKKE